MRQYLDIVKKVLDEGKVKHNRTGVDTIAIAGVMFEHEMSEGFPLLTTKQMYHKGMRVELEGFIKGITDKQWYQDRKCNIWNEWCNPQKVAYGHDEETKQRMHEERDLGPIYGWTWNHFGATYNSFDSDYSEKGINQLESVVNKLKTKPDDRRMVVSAWNPVEMEKMALPPCHYAFQVTVIDDKVNLLWNQRSVDTMLGLPFNIASYGTLLHLLAKSSGLGEGKLIGFLGDTHIYENHVEGAKEQLEREPLHLPKVVTEDFTSIFDWTHDQTRFVDYQHRGKIDFSIAV